MYEIKKTIGVFQALACVFLLSAAETPLQKSFADETEKIGGRPYEMVDAGRVEDSHPPLIDFENLDGWTVETTASEASFVRSREQRIWGDYVGQLTYKAAPGEATLPGANPKIVLKPREPIPVDRKFDCLNFWIYGNNWSWVSDPTTPQVSVSVVLRGDTGQSLTVAFHPRVNWKEWFLLHRKLSQNELETLGGHPKFEALEIHGGTNKDFRTIYFDNLSFYKEILKPLTFEPRPKRGIDLPEGQTTGTNTGPGRLPFPNREETLLPSRLASGGKTAVSASPDEKSYILHYDGPDGSLAWTYTPRTGFFDDLAFSWENKAGSTLVYHIRGGGPKFVENASGEPKLDSIKFENDELVARWKIDENEVEYRFRLVQKSLLVDVRCPGGNVEEVGFGTIAGPASPKLFSVPYLTAGYSRTRPQVIMNETGGTPLFILPLVDHTRSNASELFFVNRVEDRTVHLGGSRYLPKTDGRRNDCFERLFLNVSPVFEEVLPNIPNDPSLYKNVTADRVWRIFHSSDLDENYEYWKRIHRYGVEKMMVVDHEVFWRDGGESFTFRTKSAPGKGGDEKRKEFTRKMIGLGYIYGPYNNFTDYAPVNEHWNEDWVTRHSDGAWRTAWARCYNPKPAMAVQVEPYFSRTAQEKFAFNGGYCDVHTAVAPWVNVDYDVRVPGAGTFAATFYAYGEILLNQKRSWTGPVYSEGPAHWFYSGLSDGNFGHDVTYQTVDNPWLVDFDLLKIHPLENNCGMGYLGHFFGKRNFPKIADKAGALDRFLAATFAFGHIGYLGMETGFASGIRSYFAAQQLQSRYAKQNIKTIRYADETGKFLDTSEALLVDAVKENRIKLVYEDGLTFYINGNTETPWRCEDNGRKIAELPPNAWYVVDPKGELESWVVSEEGRRLHYVDSPAYLFANAAGNENKAPCRIGRLLCDRQLIVLKNAGPNRKQYEMIVGEADYEARSSVHAVRLDDDADADAVALDFERKEIGKAGTRYSRSMVHVLPVEGAFSYLLTPKEKPRKTLEQDRIRVVPGETVDLNGAPYSIPADAVVDSLYWTEKDGCWIDFEIVEPFVVSLNLDAENEAVEGRFRYNGPARGTCDIEMFREGTPVGKTTLRPRSGAFNDFRFKIDFSGKRKIETCKIRISPAGDKSFEKEFRLKTDLAFPDPATLPENFERGYRLRGKSEVPLDNESGAHAEWTTVSCGAVPRLGWSVHPPYKKGVGYVFLLGEPFAVPDEDGIRFSCEVGIANRITGKTDGVLYRVQVVEPDKEDRTIGELNWTEKRWRSMSCDLTPWRGKTIRLRLIADVGPKNDSNCDAGCWSEFRLVSDDIKLKTTLHEELPIFDFLPPESPLDSAGELFTAKKVELIYEGSNLNCDDNLHVEAEINGRSIGRLPAAPGGDDPPRWTLRSVALPSDAIGGLQNINRVALLPHKDSFKIRSLRLVATLADGTKKSSWINNRVYSHPSSWKYAEGVIASGGDMIPIEIPVVYCPAPIPAP